MLGVLLWDFRWAVDSRDFRHIKLGEAVGVWKLGAAQACAQPKGNKKETYSVSSSSESISSISLISASG